MAVINGRLSMEAKALLAIAQKRAGVTWHVVKEDDKACEIIFSRPGWPDTSSSFTEEEAQTAGLLSKSNWKLYRKDMLFARAASRGIRRIAPDAVLGLYSIEEMRDVPLAVVIETPVVKAATDPIPEETPAGTDKYVHGAKAGASTIDDLPGGENEPEISDELKKLAGLRDELVGIMAQCEESDIEIPQKEWDRVHVLKEEAEYKKAIVYFRGKLGKKTAKQDAKLF
jgi:hypothetical protein